MSTKRRTALTDEALAEFFEQDFEPDTDLTRVRLDALEALAAAAATRVAAEDDVTASVAAARRVGVSWPSIGRSLGVSHQAAMKKYKHLVA